MDFGKLLRFAVEHDASDVHLQAGLAPVLRIGGIIRATDQPPLMDEELHNFIVSIAPPRMRENADDRMVAGLDFSYAMPGVSRFRCSAYHQLSARASPCASSRARSATSPSCTCRMWLAKSRSSQRGLTLVTGTTGSGKSTTLAAMIDLINQHHTCKIITIEDPIEYMHTAKLALIAQLEVGTDTPSFEQALRQALRQDPDVVLVGELRDMDTLRIALRAADTGHQVFSTVHSASAPQTIERIIAMFPPAEHKLLLTQLAGNLEAIISQRLLICRDGSRRPATEILRGGPVPTKFILEGRALELGDYIKSAGNGQHTFDQDLLNLHRQELISHQEALRNATNRDALNMALRGIGSSKPPTEAPHPPQPPKHPPRPTPVHHTVRRSKPHPLVIGSFVATAVVKRRGFFYSVCPMPRRSSNLVPLVILAIAIALAVAFYFQSQKPSNVVTDQATSTAATPAPCVDLLLGNPSDATTDPANRTNYLMIKPFYSLSYNEPKGIPNWVTWRLDESDLGHAPRKQMFDADTALPVNFHHITHRDYSGSGFDRGHLCPHSDRAATTEMSFATFIMTNIIPQAPNVNREAWADLEEYCRELVEREHDHLYIIAGPAGKGGRGSRGFKQTLADGRVTVPAECWKVIVVVRPVGGTDDLAAIGPMTRVIAVLMPNDNQLVAHDWAKFRTTATKIEQETGYHFFTRLPPEVARELCGKLDTAAIERSFARQYGEGLVN